MTAKFGADIRRLLQRQQLAEPLGLRCLVIIARHHGLHLTTSELIHGNALTGRELSVPELLKCATSAGLKARALHLKWHSLARLRRALPAIVMLKHGGSMVLLRVDG